MAIKQLVPSRDWVNLINQNFNELAGSDTGWTKDGVVGMNGFDASNVSYRISALKVGGQELRIAQVDGWVKIPALRTGERRVIIKIPNIVPKDGYFTSMGSVADSSILVSDDGAPQNGIALTQIYESGSYEAYLHYLLISN